MRKYLIYLLCFVQIDGFIANDVFVVESNYGYEPNWDSLDTRPLPEWYDKAKIGIFLHWGVYSVPSFGSEWFWINWKNNSTSIVDFMSNNYYPSFTYQDFARDFKAEFFDPAEWAKLFKAAGAKYVVLTSKHHEGFTLWPSTQTYSWNAVDVGPHRDLLGDLTAAVKNESLRMGFYYSLFEWFNPRYLKDKENQFQTSFYVDNKMLPELKELIETYEPDLIWSDGDWEANDTYWKSTEFLAWLYNDSPVREEVVVNDRWGIGIPCNHGDFYNCHDRYNPGVLQPHKWENAMTVDKKSWGFRRNANYTDILTTFELIKTMIVTISCGGNILINVGPTKEGTIAPIFQERLLNLGSWLSVNGEALYESKPWIIQNDTMGETWYTQKPGVVYAISLIWPASGMISLGSESARSLFINGTTVELLGYGLTKWTALDDVIYVMLPDKARVSVHWAWVIKIF